MLLPLMVRKAWSVLGDGCWVLGDGCWVMGDGWWVIGDGWWVFGVKGDYSAGEIVKL